MDAADVVSAVVYEAAEGEIAEIGDVDLLLDLAAQAVHEPFAVRAVDLVYMPADAEAHEPVQAALAALFEPPGGEYLAPPDDGDIGDDLPVRGALLRRGAGEKKALRGDEVHDLLLPPGDEAVSRDDVA